MSRGQPPSSGFTLVEVLVTSVILGLVAALGADSMLNLTRRERANTVTTELTGWLDQVSRDASRFNAQAGGLVCTVTVNTGDIAPGGELARIEPAACAPQNTLALPDLYSNNPRANITANPDQFVFTPRGTLATTTNATLPNGQVLITITVNNERPLRCIRLVGLIGVLEVGRNNQAATGSCTEWGRV
ncbi:prepilin-type N-terminal cleavage/methylation domain-containing protein [Synechococcus sp. FGCU-3]|nr:prepilin-type N-terminal cleavage/methylation domain-containing protein [Synechococcus sp. FGCU3]